MEAGGGWKIGVIGGNGWLGSALAGAVLDAGFVKPRDLSLSYRNKRPDRFEEAFWTLDNQALADRSDVIILCVRPADWRDLNVDAKGKLLISVMAGVPLDSLSDHHQTACVVRSLPNAAVEVRRSYTPWIATPEVSEEERTFVRALFETCGVQDEVHSETDMDYFTGLSGSGPAFPALLADAMMRDALSRGIPVAMARRAVNTLIIGAGRLMEMREICPTEIVQTFLDYRGTTAVAIETMRAAGFERAIACGLTAAFEKSMSLGDAPKHL